MGQVRLNGAAEHEEPRSDLQVGESLGGQPGDRLLGRCETRPTDPGGASRTPAASLDACRAQGGVDGRDVAIRLETFIGRQRLIEDRDAEVLEGVGELADTGTAGICLDG